MDSTLLANTHIIVVTIFLLIYFIKTILIFANGNGLEKFSKAIRIPEMIISTLFLVTGIWLFIMLGTIKTFQIYKLICVFVSIPLAIVAFKKKKKILALLSFLLIVGAYGLAEMSKGKPYMPVKVILKGGDREDTKGIAGYIANCSMCHGIDGKKSYRGAADLSLSALSDAAIQDTIREGIKGKMPEFEETLSGEDIAAISSYIVTLRGK